MVVWSDEKRSLETRGRGLPFTITATPGRAQRQPAVEKLGAIEAHLCQVPESKCLGILPGSICEQIQIGVDEMFAVSQDAELETGDRPYGILARPHDPACPTTTDENAACATETESRRAVVTARRPTMSRSISPASNIALYLGIGVPEVFVSCAQIKFTGSGIGVAKFQCFSFTFYNELAALVAEYQIKFVQISVWTWTQDEGGTTLPPVPNHKKSCRVMKPSEVWCNKSNTVHKALDFSL
ncbi:hypothetical protein DFP72DRAFT_860975 [Ephemerocybe angulata]|uniref:Uncharacterized protein n=1 Tax=Ephemerocybe angulata TaxID=980116 RepID=A0A8H6H853_9AGAR|nr:hypothetical protein DFP72DRAFT_860975 [Tulosesus angulatus]